MPNISDMCRLAEKVRRCKILVGVTGHNAASIPILHHTETRTLYNETSSTYDPNLYPAPRICLSQGIILTNEAPIPEPMKFSGVDPVA